MRVVRNFYRTDACGRSVGPYRTIVLTQEEWNEKAKDLKVEEPYTESIYQYGCGWGDTKYEKAMLDTKCQGWTTYLLEGHEKPLSTKVTVTMNEYNS